MGSRRVCAGGQTQDEGRADARSAVGLDRATVCLDQLAHDRQAESTTGPARAGPLGPPATVEDKGRSSGVIGEPQSETSIRMPVTVVALSAWSRAGGSPADRRWTVPPGGVWRIAFDTSLPTSCRSRTGCARTVSSGSPVTTSRAPAASASGPWESSAFLAEGTRLFSALSTHQGSTGCSSGVLTVGLPPVPTTTPGTPQGDRLAACARGRSGGSSSPSRRYCRFSAGSRAQ